MTDAQRAEATDGTIQVQYGGETYTVDYTAMSWDTLDQDAQGNYSRVIKDLLGPDEFARFAAHNPNPIVRRDGEFVPVAAEMRAAILEAMGNSAASPGS
jgi:gamma-glutamylcysteine synthetase